MAQLIADKYYAGPAISLQYTVSLVQWVNCLLLVMGGQRFMSRGCTHSHNGSGFLLLALSHYNVFIGSERTVHYTSSRRDTRTQVQNMHKNVSIIHESSILYKVT
jgi:hypothetical protein